MNQKEKGILKVVSGLALMVAGALGVIFGKNVKARFLRIAVLVLSVTSIGGGLYLFVDGLDEIAVGVIDQYKLDSTYIQTMTYKSPEDFKDKLELSIDPGDGNPGTVHPDTRRLHFECPDKSEDFTVYFTKAGPFGIPSESVVCEDGFTLLSYQ